MLVKLNVSEMLKSAWKRKIVTTQLKSFSYVCLIHKGYMMMITFISDYT